MNSNQKEITSSNLRWMISRDYTRVLEIEECSFDYPWSRFQLVSCLRQRNTIGMVVEQDDVILGFMIYELHKKSIELASFAVAPEHRRSGVGSAMVDRLKKKLSFQIRSSVFLHVRETNLDAQLFFRRCEFRAISVMRDFYDDVPEDAYLMQYKYRGGW